MTVFDEDHVRARVERACDGDTEAFGDVVLALSPWLRQRLRRYVNGPDKLDDVVQDTFVRAYERLDRYDRSRPFAPWIARIGVNLALDRRRHDQVLDVVDDAEPWLEAVPVAADAARAVAEADLLDHVETAIDDLPPDWATVLRLRAVEEMSTQEIADALGIPFGTVLSRLSRARARLVSRLTERFGSGPWVPETAKEEDPS